MNGSGIMADKIIQNIYSLSANERFDLLQNLVRHLSSKECEFVIASIAQRNDPFRILPTELILQILDHLPLFTTWTLRSVCKQWQGILSSENCTRAAVARWQTHDPSDTAYNGSSEDSLESEIQHLRAMKTGKPTSVRTINDTATRMQTGAGGPYFRLAWRRMDMKGSRVAYVSSHRGQGDAVVVLDIISGEKSIYRGEAREQILLVILTTHVVAFITYHGTLYVQRFSDPHGPLRRAQLPSTNVKVAGGHGLTLAVVTDDFAQDGLPVSSVILFNAETGQLRNLAPDRTSRSIIRPECQYDRRKLDSCGILVDETKEVVDLFALWECIRYATQQASHWKTLQTQHVRLSFAGQILASSMREQAIDIHSLNMHHPLTMADPHPTGYRNQYRIVNCQLGQSDSLPLRIKGSVLFDSERGRFLKAHESGEFLGQKQVVDILWKGKHHRPRTAKGCWEYVSYMNDSFLVSLEVSRRDTSQSRIRIECFDPRIRMAESEDVSVE